MSPKTYKYKFSFVIPIYNVEEYLAETVESILAQTMDFEQNCEIIFVNDGSPDNSEEVCLRYKEQFPNNVTYIKQENSGPGAARNRGIKVAAGKYISLLDPDDKLSQDTLEEVHNFLEDHYDEIDFVSIKQLFFEARHGQHPLNYKFSRSKVVDVSSDFDWIQLSLASSFFKASVFDYHQYNAAVGRYAEDARLMGEILLDNPKYGVLSKPVYFYRKRADQMSSLDLNITDKFWYLETPKRAFGELFDYAREKKGKIPKFIQFIAMYDVQWRLKQSVQTVLTDEEVADYKNSLFRLLKEIDDDVIMAQRQIDTIYKLYALSKKHNEQVLIRAKRKQGKYYYGATQVYNLNSAPPPVHIEFLEVSRTELTIEGFFEGFLFGGATLQFRVGPTKYDAVPVDRPQRRIEFLGDLVSGQNCFKIVVPISPGDSIEAFVSDGPTALPLVTHRFSRISQSAAFGYSINGRYIIRRSRTGLLVRQYTHLRQLGYELRFWLALSKRLKLRVTLEQYRDFREARISGMKAGISDLKWLLVPAKAAARNAYVIAFRATYYAIKPFLRRPIWLISDRVLTAGDSGEILFRYMSEQSKVPARVYFAISSKSGAYKRLKRYGKVLDYHSVRYKLLFLLSNKVISSEATDHTINAFGGRIDDLVDLYNFDFVFLQHGVIKDDISDWLGRYSKNIKLFITSAKPEQKSIASSAYGYDDTIVKLTGLPRYDFLTDQPKNKIMLMPTWRKDLAGEVDPRTGHRLYNPGFKRSAYFQFYQRLVEDEQLAAVMQKHGFTGEFCLHHVFRWQVKDFEEGAAFKIMDVPFDDRKAKSEGNLLITDFSSAAFDFAYLNKPVIYAHFDEDAFYKLHTSKAGYFSYEEDGFGPVTYDYDGTVRQIIKAIESGCIMETKYQKRLDKFFAFRDKSNSQRVYEAIIEMDKGR